MSRTKRVTRTDLKQLVIKWQKRLRLMDWDINVDFDESGMLEENDAWGMCQPQGFIRSATMLFRQPEEAVQRQPKFDLEEIIVHELLHIFFAPFNHEIHAELNAEEQMVHTVAILLVSLERQGKKVTRATSFDDVDTIVNLRHKCASHSVKKERKQGKHGI